MKEIKTFDELIDIQDDFYDTACAMDLMFIRHGYWVVEGIVLLIGADSKFDLELFYISRQTYENFTQGIKDYLKRHYDL